MAGKAITQKPELACGVGILPALGQPRWLSHSLFVITKSKHGWAVRINHANPHDDFVELYEEFRRFMNYLKQRNYSAC